MTTSSRKPPSREAQNALLGDLESIRSLLEPDASRAARRRAAEPKDDDIPTLDDVVDGAPRVDEPSHRTPPGTDRKPPTGLADETFDALLGDQWREAADRILEDARAQLESRTAEWAGDDASDFAEALKTRLNDVVRGWLAEVVRTQLEDLRETLTAAIEIEIDAHAARLKDSTDDAE